MHKPPGEEIEVAVPFELDGSDREGGYAHQPFMAARERPHVPDHDLHDDQETKRRVGKVIFLQTKEGRAHDVGEARDAEGGKTDRDQWRNALDRGDGRDIGADAEPRGMGHREDAAVLHEDRLAQRQGPVNRDKAHDAYYVRAREDDGEEEYGKHHESGQDEPLHAPRLRTGKR